MFNQTFETMKKVKTSTIIVSIIFSAVILSAILLNRSAFSVSVYRIKAQITKVTNK